MAYGTVGSTIRVKDNAVVYITTGRPLYLGNGLNTYGTLEILDNAVVDLDPTGCNFYAGFNRSVGVVDINGGTLETYTATLGGGMDSNTTINIIDGSWNFAYRTWVGSTSDSDSAHPETININISGGEIRYDGSFGASSVFSVGNAINGNQSITITQTGGDVNFINLAHFNLGDMGDDNTCKWLISGGSLTHGRLFRNGRDDQGAGYGSATAEFEVTGTAPNIFFEDYKSTDQSTLRAILDANGVSTIDVNDTATFLSGSKLEVSLDDGVTLSSDLVTDFLIADTITDNGMIESGSNTADWEFAIVTVDSKDVLRITYYAD
jgi:hypothetical protein